MVNGAPMSHTRETLEAGRNQVRVGAGLTLVPRCANPVPDANRDAGLLLPKPGRFHAVLREPIRVRSSTTPVISSGVT